HRTRDGELADVRMLRGLEAEQGMPRVHVTFMAAHAVPPEFFGRRHDYIDAVSSWCADAAAIGADSVDVYCEEGRFSEDEARWILSAGRRSGLLPRLHACGDSRTGAAGLAAELGCASADAPGVTGITSMSLVISMAVSYFGMSVEEALRAATIGGAHALRAPDRGAMVRGRLADMVLWDADHEGAFVWSYGLTPRRVWLGGEPISAS